MHPSGPHELDLIGIICTISSWVKIHLPMEEQVITSNCHVTGCLQTSEIFHHHHHLHIITFGIRIDTIPREGLIIHLSMSICNIFLSQGCPYRSSRLGGSGIHWTSNFMSRLTSELSAGIRVISDGRNFEDVLSVELVSNKFYLWWWEFGKCLKRIVLSVCGLSKVTNSPTIKILSRMMRIWKIFQDLFSSPILKFVKFLSSWRLSKVQDSPTIKTSKFFSSKAWRALYM